MRTDTPPIRNEQRAAQQARKQRAALFSMGITFLLVLGKLTVALLSGSLGLLSDALHSGMDLIGTIVSFAAVRVGDRPPDANHPYGHAKAESLAALFAVFLLAMTALGICYEAYRKAFVVTEIPEISPWSMGVPVLAMVIDWNRARSLAGVARVTGSQALAADAANFASDLWSSAVVLAGLSLIWVGEQVGWPAQWLSGIDAASGALVAVVIFHVAWGLAGRTIDSLMDAVPRHLVPALQTAAARTAGVVATTNARLHYVGDQAYADLVVNVPRGLSLEESEAISEDVIHEVRQVVPQADVVVHTHPVAPAGERATDLTRVIAARAAVGVHHVRAFRTARGLRLDMHMEVPATQTLAEAHAAADAVEAGLRAELGDLDSVEIHIEPRHDELYAIEPLEDGTLRRQVIAAAEQIAGPGMVRQVDLGRTQLGAVLTIHCGLPGRLPITEAHARTAEIERAVRDATPGAYRVTVHPEPI